MKPAATLSRRALLGFSLAAVAACKHHPATSPPAVDPDAGALAAARAAEHLLLDAATDPAEHAIHAAHLVALGGHPRTAVLATAQPPPSLQGSADSLRIAALGAVTGEHAAVLASIAASHEAMAHE